MFGVLLFICRRQASDCRVKLAISYALAQSSMLTLYEDRIASLVAEVRTKASRQGVTKLQAQCLTRAKSKVRMRIDRQQADLMVRLRWQAAVAEGARLCLSCACWLAG